MPPPRAPMLPAWRHVLAMSDEIGIFEHADRSVPRREEGYCADDVARLLIAIVRESSPGRELTELARTCLRFLVDAQGVTGRVRNRRRAGRAWSVQPVDVPLADFKKDEVATLRAEPQLVVEDCEL